MWPNRSFSIFSRHDTENIVMLPNLVISGGRRRAFPLSSLCILMTRLPVVLHISLALAEKRESGQVSPFWLLSGVACPAWRH